MNEWVWSNGGMILTEENWSTGWKTLYSVGGRWIYFEIQNFDTNKVEIKIIFLFLQFSVTVHGHQLSEGIFVKHRKRKNGVTNSYTHKC